MLRGGSGLPPPPAPLHPGDISQAHMYLCGEGRGCHCWRRARIRPAQGCTERQHQDARRCPPQLSAAGGARLTPRSPSSQPAALGMPPESCVVLPPRTQLFLQACQSSADPAFAYTRQDFQERSVSSSH